MQADCHRHLAGSLSVPYVWSLIHKHKAFQAAKDIEDVKRKMTYLNGEQQDFNLFLKKFNILNSIPWKLEDVRTAVECVLTSLRQEGINYCELKFSLYKYGHDNAVAAARIICEELQKVKEGGLLVLPILSFKYEGQLAEQIWLSNSILQDKVSEQIHGIDFVGDERFFNDPNVQDVCKIICQDWLAYGKMIAMHVGESQTGLNVRKAIKMGARRICHGLRALQDDPAVLDFAKDLGVCFDMALSSNFRTGVVKDLRDHPIRQFLRKGCEVTIGTDDPVVLNTTLENEYRIAKGLVNLAEEEIEILKMNAAERRQAVS